MGKSGIGVGSASIVLVFAVLCLTVFSLITFIVAGNDKNLVDAKAGLVTGYYEADTLSELILSDILSAAGGGGGSGSCVDIPDNIRGVNIVKTFDDNLNKNVINFSCDISASKALFVSLVIHDDFFDILAWHMYDIGDWDIDNSINVWTGD